MPDGVTIEDEYDRFAAILQDWRALAAVPDGVIQGWSEHLDVLRRAEDVPRHTGLWARGPTDLMGVLRLSSDEVRHCMVLSWLLGPEAAHGVGIQILARLLDHCAPGYQLRPGKRIRVDAELPRAIGTAEATRADTGLLR